MYVARSGTQKTSKVSSLDQALMQNLREIHLVAFYRRPRRDGPHLSKYYSLSVYTNLNMYIYTSLTLIANINSMQYTLFLGLFVVSGEAKLICHLAI